MRYGQGGGWTLKNFGWLIFMPLLQLFKFRSSFRHGHLVIIRLEARLQPNIS